MKKLVWIVVAASSLLLASCFEHEQMGYPKEVKFPKEGGTIVVTGDEFITHVELVDKDCNDNNHAVHGDTMVTSLDWLTVELPSLNFTNTLIITAAPSAETKSRKMRIEGYSGPSYMEIKVVQN